MGKQTIPLNHQIYSSEQYNRVDKINMNDNKIVSPEKTGTRHFDYASEIAQPKTRQIDDLHIESQGRHLGNVYVPKKGQGNSGVNQMKSSITEVIKTEDTRGKYGGMYDSPTKATYIKEQASSDVLTW
jgi:hypothetical protein